MKSKSLVAFVMVWIMVFASFVAITTVNEATSAGLLNATSFSSNIRGNSTGTSNMYYTMYVPNGQFRSSAVKEELNSIGINPDISGNLWTFSASTAYAVNINNTLHNISLEFHTTYFSAETQTLAYPSVQGFGIPSSNSIPFAYTPSLISRAYNFTWALNHGINGKGQTIVIVDAYGDPNIAYDLKAFDGVNKLPVANLTVEYPYGTPGVYNSTWATETSTDVEWAHALAPGANIVLLVAVSAYTGYLQQLVSYAVQHKLGGIISLSWGTPESGLDANAVNTYNKVYEQAASQGIDVFAASGDLGAKMGTSQLTVSFPASDPWVTGVGGTSLYVLNNEFRQYGWGGLNNGQTYGSGGGYSSFFNTPYWQNTTGYNGTMRGVPDVSMDADKYTGVYVISDGAQYTVGGTSVATPMWADVAALLRQYTNTTPPSLNPLLYQIARSPLYTSSFTEITTGSNGHYNNTLGWNPVTGLGTPKVSNLLNATRSLLGGYGGNVIFNGITDYNATSVRGNLNIALNSRDIALNGTTFYYLGFFSGNQDSVKFGVSVNSTGEQLHLEIKQDNYTVERYFSIPSGFTGNLSGFSVEVTYTGSSIEVSTSGSFHYTLPVFLNFSGSMVPIAGASQAFSETNLTVIDNAQIADIQTFNGTNWSNVTRMFFEPFSAFSTPSYSTINAAFSHKELKFFTGKNSTTSLLNGTNYIPPEIEYHIAYGYPLLGTFYIPQTQTKVSWFVNGTPITGSTYSFPVSGGSFMVNGSFVDAQNVLVNVSRNITLPGMVESNLSLNYSISGYNEVPKTTVTTMWFYNYLYSKSMKIPTLNTTYQLGLFSRGFYPISKEMTPESNISITLAPEAVNVTIFVFNVNSSVTFNNKSIPGHWGYFYDKVLPTTSLNVTVSAPGFFDYNMTFSLEPGLNLTNQVVLLPVDLNSSMISGEVTDYLYSFPLENAVVSLKNYSGSYTNSSGGYILYATDGKYDLNATAPLYQIYSTPLNVSSNSILNIQLKPAKISLETTTPIDITHYFPLLFTLGFISWSDYKGSNFSKYQIYVSSQSDFLNPTITTVWAQNTSYTFLTGIYPGHTYYITVVLWLTNSQVYQSKVVKISYSDPVYLTVNVVLVGALGFYVYIAYRIFRKK